MRLVQKRILELKEGDRFAIDEFFLLLGIVLKKSTTFLHKHKYTKVCLIGFDWMRGIQSIHIRKYYSDDNPKVYKIEGGR